MVEELDDAIDNLAAGGRTNHEDAFIKALELFNPSSSSAKVMIMFTDGVTTAGGDANIIATAAKAQGVIIYCIGLSGNGGIDVNALNDWASDPDSAYVAITPDDSELEFTVQHVGPCSGTSEVNKSIDYDDDEDNAVNFPSPEIEVDFGITVHPEGCPEADELDVEGCRDSVEFNAYELGLESLGRIVQPDVTLKSVCPGKRVALAVILSETDDHCIEYTRGMKTMVVPAHNSDSCRDVTVKCIKFILPEELDVCGSASSIYNKRKLKARFIAHYIDSDFSCCDVVI